MLTNLSDPEDQHRGEGRKVGHTYSQPGLIIATTARHYEFTVVTRDHVFSKAGAAVLNPWTR
jgi:predicted nucleic acid-binding protein